MNISIDNVCLLDFNDNATKIAYEKALFRTFSSALTNTSHLIFNINNKEKLLRSKIPYESQEVYVYKWSDAIVAGMAINFNMENTLQLEMLNFKLEARENACEALAIFSSLDLINSMNVLKILAEFLVKRLKEKNISTIYATSSEKRAKAYKQMGFIVIDQYSFDGQGKCLLQKTL
jgi:hypothetical protein